MLCNIKIKLTKEMLLKSSINYLNVVKESTNTIKLTGLFMVLMGGFVFRVLEGSAGATFSLRNIMVLLGVVTLVESAADWIDQMLIESRYLGRYTKKVTTGLVYGSVLFISSEAFLFMSLLCTAFDGWANQSQYTSPTYELSSELFLVGEVVIATVILVLSSATMNTYKALYDSYDISEFNSLSAMSTQILGVSFILFQIEEYTRSTVVIFTSNTTSGFFMVTGFHGLHVLIGWLLLVDQMEMATLEMRSTNSVGIFYSQFYWHFVDAVWLFVIP